MYAIKQNNARLDYLRFETFGEAVEYLASMHGPLVRYTPGLTLSEIDQSRGKLTVRYTQSGTRFEDVYSVVEV